MIEFDVETTGLQPYSGANEAFLWIFSSEPDGSDAEAITFWPSDGPENDPEAHARIQWWFDRAIEDGGIRAHNAKFDRGFAEMSCCFRLPGDGMWHDSMIVAHAIDERRSVALKAIAAKLFGDEAAAPQKVLKDWLNKENDRRRSIVDRAEKIDINIGRADARIERARILVEKRKTPAAIEKAQASLDKAIVERDELVASKPQVLAEAEAYYREDGTFVYANYADVPDEIMEPYALEDVILTKKISQVYDPRMYNEAGELTDIGRTVEFERKAMDALFAIEKRGLPADATAYRRLEFQVIENIERLKERVMDLAQQADPVKYAQEMADYRSDKNPGEWGEGKKFVRVSEDGVVTSWEGGAARLDEFNPNSTPMIIAALKARGADLKYMSQEDGKLSADADNLRAVDDELAVAILEYRSEFKVLSTYVRPMLGRTYVSSMNTYKEPFIAPDGRIHATYRQVGARTGRMSCADPNMQNQPRDDLRLRWNIRAEEGHVLVACDLTNIEMVLFAAYCGPGRLLTAVKNGEDLHTLTAKMLGLRDRKRPGGGIETARQLGKTYNFSRIYGGGLRTIRRSFRCDLNEARRLKNRFDEAYPEVGDLTNRIKWRLEDDGYVQDSLISGRRFRVATDEAYKATNYLVQGTAASLLKYAVIKLHEDGVPMVALVHDEVVAHVPVEDAEEVAKLIELRMTEYEGLKGLVPLRAEAEIISHWSDAKPLKEQLVGPDGVTPLIGDDGEPLTRGYFFDPEWIKERRYINQEGTPA